MALNITLRQLSVFEGVATELSFTRAAEKLHLSQPAVSMQVKQLEQAVGTPLLEQLGKKIYLTEVGQEMHRCAQAISNQLADTEQRLQELQGLHRGSLTIAAVSTVNYFAAGLLADYLQAHGDVRVSLNVTNRAEVLQQLANNDVDLALMGQVPDDLDLVAESFMDNPLVIVAPANHPLLNQAEVSLDLLSQQTFLMREPESGTRKAIERYFAEHNLEPKASMQMNSNEAIKHGVEVGLGLGIVSLHTVTKELAGSNLKVLAAEGFPIMRRWYVVHRRSKRLSAAAETFRDLVLQQS